MTDIKSAQDVSLRDELTGESMLGANKGNNIANTNLFATDVYGQYNASLPSITDGNYTSLQTDNKGRLIVTSVAGPGSSTHIIIDDATNPATQQATVDTSNHLVVQESDTTNKFYGTTLLGNNAVGTHIDATTVYGQYNTIPRPTVTNGQFTPLQIDNSGRLVITSEQGGPALHIIIDDTTNPLLFQAEVHPDNFLKTKGTGSPMLYENFSAITGFDNAKWVATDVSGATHVQQLARLEMNTTTTSGSTAKILSRGYWEFFAGSTLSVDFAVRFNNTQPTNNYKLWGVGSDENDGVFFKLVGSSLYAVERFLGTETPYDITAFKPTDGFIHEYRIVVRDTAAFLYIDGLSVKIMKAQTQDLFRYTKMKLVFENENTALSSGASTLYVHHCGLADDTTQQVVLGRSNLGLRVTNELIVDGSYAVISNLSWRRLLTYTIPGANIVEAMGMRSSSGTSSGRSRLSSRVNLATYSWTSGSPGTYVDQNIYTQPRYGALLEALQTVASGGGADVTVTVTYTNQDGVVGRTATLNIPKSQVIGSRYTFTLQAGDLGVIDITAVSHSGNNTGGLEIFGVTELCRHHHNTADVVSETIFAKESVMLSGDDILDLEIYHANTTGYPRFISAIFTIS